MQTLRFESATPGVKFYLLIEPAFGALRCKLMEPRTDKDLTVLFVISSPAKLVGRLTADLKAHAKQKGVSVATHYTWTDSDNGFNFHLTPKDAQTLLATLKEKFHV